MTGAQSGPSFDSDPLGAPPARLRRPNGEADPVSPNSNRGFVAMRQLWLRAATIVLVFVALLYGIEGVDHALGDRLEQAGIEPRTGDGLSGIAFAPVLHGGWDHLVGNTLPVLVLGFLALAAGIGRGLAATAIIWLVAGVGTWLTGATGTTHLGASMLVFGWLVFLISRGWFSRSIGQIVLGLVVLATYGSLLWGVLPGPPGISWQGHLFGALGGLFAGWVLSGDERRHRRVARTRVSATPR